MLHRISKFTVSLIIFFISTIILSVCGNELKFTIENVKFRSPGSFRIKRTVHPKREKGVAQNVTHLLNNVLKNYDQHFRPGFNSGKPTKVYIDLFIRTMGPVSDLFNTYSFNCYFRQKWTDDRLHFNNSGIGFRQLSLSMAMLDKIWKPDTYFWNGAGSYVHGITTSNRLVRLEPDGTILYSSRITVKAKCQMDMSRYPLDKQACRLVIGSYAYSSDEVQYKWRIMGDDNGVKIDYESIADLPQFSLSGFKVYKPANITRDKEYSALEVRFYFDRHFGYFLMNFYVPCALVVLLCWVAFFTKREATAERIGIGITNVLTIVLISMDSKSDSPKVDSPTALEVFIWICYLTHLICMVEFTVVHYHTKYNTGDPEIQEVERERLRQIIKQIPKNTNNRATEPTFRRRNAALPVSIARPLPNKTKRFMSVRQPKKSEQTESIQLMRKISNMESTTHNEVESSLNLESIRQENVGWRLYYWMIDHNIKTDPFGVAQNSTSRIDKISVIVAPLIFILTIALYYDFYVNRVFKFNFDNDFGTM
ncbi:Ligand-Gated ion Channel [Caenorhabditis elegans]|uniref:Ligand-Gated ion Channel n=1 Tax=Caenorhabditis elegans TaxID=6239 RepID=Q6BET0_CAEEL|nr:Ligand-Gated ion Channel [Caenorhabditis elegans]CAH04701.1 Ligand-Gated ion Channel [Caenorhabditis elegans]|eukprot:NP_001023766.1 Ligand-Gated ion Channel [Caenorhabditis elegans]